MTMIPRPTMPTQAIRPPVPSCKCHLLKPDDTCLIGLSRWRAARRAYPNHHANEDIARQFCAAVSDYIDHCMKQ